MSNPKPSGLFDGRTGDYSTYFPQRPRQVAYRLLQANLSENGNRILAGFGKFFPFLPRVLVSISYGVGETSEKWSLQNVDVWSYTRPIYTYFYIHV